jgi:hypothetical protein
VADVTYAYYLAGNPSKLGRVKSVTNALNEEWTHYDGYTNLGQLNSVTYDIASSCVPVTYTYNNVTGRMTTSEDSAGMQ